MALDLRSQVKPHHPLALLYHNAPDQEDKSTGHAVASHFRGVKWSKTEPDVNHPWADTV